MLKFTYKITPNIKIAVTLLIVATYNFSLF